LVIYQESLNDARSTKYKIINHVNDDLQLKITQTNLTNQPTATDKMNSHSRN